MMIISFYELIDAEMVVLCSLPSIVVRRLTLFITIIAIAIQLNPQTTNAASHLIEPLGTASRWHRYMLMHRIGRRANDDESQPIVEQLIEEFCVCLNLV